MGLFDTVYDGLLGARRRGAAVKKISELKVLMFINMLSKFQAKRRINEKVMFSDILVNLGYLGLISSYHSK